MLIAWRTHIVIVNQDMLEMGNTAALKVKVCYQNGAIECIVFLVLSLSNTGMRNLVTITKADAHFRCDSSCNVSFFAVTWYKDGTPISSFQNQYGLANDGMLLYIENLTTANTGEYACQVHSAGTTFKRYGNLEVLDVRKTNFASSPCCKSFCQRRFTHK